MFGSLHAAGSKFFGASREAPRIDERAIDVEIEPLVTVGIDQRAEHDEKFTVERGIIEKVHDVIGFSKVCITEDGFREVRRQIRLIGGHRLPSVRVSDQNYVMQLRIDMTFLASKLNELSRPKGLSVTVHIRAGNVLRGNPDVIDLSIAQLPDD